MLPDHTVDIFSTDTNSCAYEMICKLDKDDLQCEKADRYNQECFVDVDG
jgi:hypothetical protein